MFYTHSPTTWALVWRRNSLYSLRTSSRKITHRHKTPKSAYLDITPQWSSNTTSMTMNMSHPSVNKAKGEERVWESCRKRRLQELWRKVLPISNSSDGQRSIGGEESTSDHAPILHKKMKRKGKTSSIWWDDVGCAKKMKRRRMNQHLTKLGTSKYYALRWSVCRKRANQCITYVYVIILVCAEVKRW